MSHTPAPWGFVYDGSSTWSVGLDDDPQGCRIAAVQKCHPGESGWHEAADNAQLIAAAPDLLAELKNLVTYISDDEATDAARAVIAKAEGR